MSIRFVKPVLPSFLFAATMLSACGQSAPPPAAQAVAVRVEPPSIVVPSGGSTRFAANVTGSALTSVTWSVQEGPTCGTIAPDGTYAAPTFGATCHVVATSAADPAVAAVATVTVSPPPVVPTALGISPASATLDACRGQVFSVTGAAAADVTWSIEEPGGGTVTDGAYVAPSAQGTYHVLAALRSDSSKASRATVTVGPERVLSVAVTPGTSVLTASGTQAFAAAVTTTCGTFPAQ